MTAGSKSTSKDYIRNRSLSLIDFDLVRKELATHTTFFLTENMLRKMAPSYIPAEVERLQRETSEGRMLMQSEELPSLRSLVNISKYIQRAELGGILNGRELMEIAESMDALSNLRSTVISASEEDYLIYRIARGMADLTHLSYSIRSKITRNGLVKDDATPHLGSLRKQVRDAYYRVTVSLNNIIDNKLENAIQDDVISVRGDRLVIQIKTNMRSRVPGVVHDVSNSGQTLFIEPFSTVHQCNSWRELVLEEEREIARVLMELSSSAGSFSYQIDSSMELAAKLDLIFSRARYSNSIAATDPIKNGTKHYSFHEDLKLENVQHPLLDEPVPLSIKIGPEWNVLVITGPNTGGKTVALKTVGLLAAMQQTGIHIPAKATSSLPIFDGIYADIGDQQSIQNSVSTFSSHIKTLNAILNHCGDHSLVLLDEIGASTDPEEGAAIATSILEHLATERITTIATTHHRGIAANVQENPSMHNASFHLDPDTLEPTYQISIGIPGMSYALQVADRLGLPKDILEKAKKNVSFNYKKMGNLIEQIGSQRNELIKAVEENDILRRETLELRVRLEEKLDYLLEHNDQIIESVQEQYQRKMRQVENLVAKARLALNSNRNLIRGKDELKKAEHELSNIEKTITEIEITEVKRSSPLENFNIGDVVLVKRLNLKGIIKKIRYETDEAEIQAGNVKMIVSTSRLKSVHEETHERSEITNQPVLHHSDTGSQELDIRGLRIEAALTTLDKFLDSSILEGLSKVRIIHGIGTGALKQAVRETLKSHPLVSQFGPEEVHNGADGATYVILT